MTQEPRIYPSETKGDIEISEMHDNHMVNAMRKAIQLNPNHLNLVLPDWWSWMYEELEGRGEAGLLMIGEFTDTYASFQPVESLHVDKLREQLVKDIRIAMQVDPDILEVKATRDVTLEHTIDSISIRLNIRRNEWIEY